MSAGLLSYFTYQDPMLAKRILPCLDVKAGRVVKGVNFVNLKDAGDPVELAKVYNEAGADELVFLDITATHEDRNIITMDGTGEASLDPEGEKFPWKPKTFSEIWPREVQTKSGLIDSSTLDKKHLMLYFSGKWK